MLVNTLEAQHIQHACTAHKPCPVLRTSCRLFLGTMKQFAGRVTQGQGGGELLHENTIRMA